MILLHIIRLDITNSDATHPDADPIEKRSDTKTTFLYYKFIYDLKIRLKRTSISITSHFLYYSGKHSMNDLGFYCFST